MVSVKVFLEEKVTQLQWQTWEKSVNFLFRLNTLYDTVLQVWLSIEAKICSHSGVIPQELEAAEN